MSLVVMVVAVIVEPCKSYSCCFFSQVKSELQEKNSKLSDTLTKVREDLKSAERDRTLLEDEKRRLQTQLTTVQRQASNNETALQMANQVNDNNYYIMDISSVCLSVISLWRLLCCTDAAPDFAVVLHGPRRCDPLALPHLPQTL